MNIRSTLLVFGALTGLAIAASAADDPGERCLEASAEDDPKAAVAACEEALKADPDDDRARRALEDARAEIARVGGMDHPAKQKQN